MGWYVRDRGMVDNGYPEVFLARPLSHGSSLWGTMDQRGDYEPREFQSKEEALDARRRYASGLQGVDVVRA